MIMIIFIHKKDTLQIMVINKQQSPNLRMPVESYKKLIWLIVNLKAIIILILQILSNVKYYPSERQTSVAN